MTRRRNAIPRLILAVLACIPGWVLAQAQVELNGWRLQQLEGAVDATMGVPVKVVDDAHTRAKAYMIDEHAYMVFEVDDRFPNYIQSVQLTGSTAMALPFRGLLLGDSDDKVRATLGTPTATVEIGEPKVTRYEYAGRNYSVEVDAQGRLFSIRLHTSDEVLTDPADPGDADPWPAFEAAVLARDFNGLAELLRPDVEIYLPGETLSIRRRYRDFIAAPDARFAAALFADHGSVRANLTRSRPERELRLIEHVGVGPVYKFPQGGALKEIVFLPYAGTFRVYEIAFHGAPEEDGYAPGETLLGAR